MATKYLQVYYTGEVFEYSKTPQPEFEEFTNKAGTVSYRKYYTKGVTGVLESVSIQNSDFGTRVMVTLKNDEDLQILQFQLNDQRGNIDDYTESLIKFLPNMVKGEEYVIYPYYFSAEDNQKSAEDRGDEPKAKYYSSCGVSVKHSLGGVKGEKVEPALAYKGDGDNVIPQLVWKENKATKKKKPTAVSVEAKIDFLTEKLLEATDGHLKRETTSSTPPPATKKEEGTKPSTKVNTPPVMDTTDDDDLPF